MLKHKLSDQDLPLSQQKRTKCGPSPVTPNENIASPSNSLPTRSKASLTRYQFEDPPIASQSTGDLSTLQPILKSQDGMTLRVERYEAYSWAERKNRTRRERNKGAQVTEGSEVSTEAEVLDSPPAVDFSDKPSLPKPRCISEVGTSWRKKDTSGSPSPSIIRPVASSPEINIRPINSLGYDGACDEDHGNELPVEADLSNLSLALKSCKETKIPRPSHTLSVGRKWHSTIDRSEITPTNTLGYGNVLQDNKNKDPNPDKTLFNSYPEWYWRQQSARHKLEQALQNGPNILPPFFHQENSSDEITRLSQEQEQALIEFHIKPFANPNAISYAANTGARKNTFLKGVLPYTSYSLPEPDWYHNTGAQKGVKSSGVDPNTEYTGDVMVFPIVDVVRKGRLFWPGDVVIAVCDKYEEFIDRGTQTADSALLTHPSGLVKVAVISNTIAGPQHSAQDPSRGAEVRQKSSQVSVNLEKAVEIYGIPKTLADLEAMTTEIANSIETIPDPALLGDHSADMSWIETEMPPVSDNGASREQEWEDYRKELTAALEKANLR